MKEIRIEDERPFESVAINFKSGIEFDKYICSEILKSNDIVGCSEFNVPNKLVFELTIT